MNDPETNPNMENKCPQCGAPLPSGVLAGLCPACLMKQGAAEETAAAPDLAQFQPPDVAELAKLFPQLEILSLIGKGGMGAVYRARQPALDRIVALKILPPQAATGPRFVERFNREARALARLNHPNIVAVYEFGQAGVLSYFVMEFVDGLNLRELERAGKLSPREALQIVPQICEALQFAHDEGIVHRDIKPENILLDKKGRVKIADFGIAKILGAAAEIDLTGTQAAIGTPHYMAPEQMEKPTAVDHRADIFSLGVVFYEMLTGELPLGKFGPPSSRKVEVDVRLDDVVLRALEKDPELRYQHASQVKTAVDTIAGSAASPPPSPAATATALGEAILKRDYTLGIRSCVRRAWKLLKSEFWPIVGVTALMLALLGFASSFGGASISRGQREHAVEISSTLALLVGGPLIGGLFFYLLKKIRREAATVETAFCGFSSKRFLHLFLAAFVTGLLTWLGFICFVLPGLYLAVAWMFTLPLVIDKGLDFWAAMELSRKVVTKHWFKFLGLQILMLLLVFAGAVAFGFGVLVMIPLVLITMLVAYEDVFGGAAPAVASEATGPSGTVVMPATPAPSATPAGTLWTPATKIGLAGVAVVLCILAFVELARTHAPRRMPREPLAHLVEIAPPQAPVVPAQSLPATFSLPTEWTLTNGTAINLATGDAGSLPSSILEMNRGPEKDSAIGAWMESADMDLAFISPYDGFFGMMRDMTTFKREEWDSVTPGSLSARLHDTGQNIPARFGDSRPMNNPTNFTYGFKTRSGMLGLLQITAFSEDPSAAEIRSVTFQPATNQDLSAAGGNGDSGEFLLSRLDAASEISAGAAKDESLAAIAMDAAQMSQWQIVRQAVERMTNPSKRDSIARQAAVVLAQHNLRQPALELAKSISNPTLRDQALGELAH